MEKKDFKVSNKEDLHMELVFKVPELQDLLINHAGFLLTVMKSRISGGAD